MARFNLGRRAGMLLPLSSVRGPRGGIGVFSDLPRMAKLLKLAGCSLWQLLPLNEVAPGKNSPYSASSSFALDPLYIDLSQVPEHDEAAFTSAERELLERDRQSERSMLQSVRSARRGALSRAFARFKAHGEDKIRAAAFAEFCARESRWLPDFALHRALEDKLKTDWRQWEPMLRDRVPAALEAARRDLALPIEELCWVQWLADDQWRTARAACGLEGVTLIGDLPFMCAAESADVWSMQPLFRLDATVCAPPDEFSPAGQDWGLPLPRWDEMRAQGDPWLSLRAERMSSLYAAFRVDHTVGLYRTYARTHWAGGESPLFATPGEEPLQRAQGTRICAILAEGAQVLAEAPSAVPDYVRDALARLGLPDTKLLRWEHDAGLPRDVRQFPTLSATVTGTHDTETLAIWWGALDDRERGLQLAQPELRVLTGEDARGFTQRTRDALLELAYRSSSDALIIPITDALGWSERMNTPGTESEENWTWRLRWPLGELERAPEIADLIARLHALAERSGRLA